SNTRFGQLHLIDPTAASATEVLYAWFTQIPEWNQKITPDIATLLLTGLITDTRSFQNPNTTPRSLELAAELLERGARQQEIIQHIYKTKPLSTLKIWGRALNRIQMDSASGIVWSSISKEDLLEMGALSKETHGILDELISTIPNADVHVLFTEMEEGEPLGKAGAWGELKASMRSSAMIDSSRLAAETFGGGGHARAAGFRVRSFANFSLQVLECVKKLVEGMKRQRTDAEEISQSPAPLPAPSSVSSFIAAPEAPPAKETPLPSPAPHTDIVAKISPTSQNAQEKDIVEGLMEKP
ncbi:hypothetical protein HYR82_00460, partial [Candidatus Peregrinibacteria bacterium]|nr:hypothetical protein [Candidatus Peregrinibacteria bacterium]